MTHKSDYDQPEFNGSLVNNLSLFQTFVKNVEDVIFITTAAMDKIIYISPSYEKIWGQSRESLIQNPKNWMDFILEEDLTEISEKLQSIQDSQKNLTYEYRILRSDNT